ncbi:MAG TPA: DUF1003 domain-containing protein [Caulobacteraceae bacterium]|jgi:uncharacterized membrane protein|nr:DUF1003 domain-containing protein [Caulobacteraceae bacterium]
MTEAHVPHPHIARRKAQGVALTSDEHVGFNGWLAALITKGFGSMWAFYVLVLWMFAWMFLATAGFWIFQYDKYPFTFLLFLSNLVQLWALPVLAVGQQVLSRASDKQALQTFRDAEAVLELTDHIHGLVQANNKLTDEIHGLVQVNNRLTDEIHRAVAGAKA